MVAKGSEPNETPGVTQIEIVLIIHVAISFRHYEKTFPMVPVSIDDNNNNEYSTIIH